MPKLSKKERIIWEFFIHSETGKRSYNERCVRCILTCKQSFRSIVVECQRYVSRNSKVAKQDDLSSEAIKKRR